MTLTSLIQTSHDPQHRLSTSRLFIESKRSYAKVKAAKGDSRSVMRNSSEAFIEKLSQIPHEVEFFTPFSPFRTVVVTKKAAAKSQSDGNV
jgi:hypothetical protein